MKQFLLGALRPLALLACLVVCPTPLRADASLFVYDFNLGPSPANNVAHVKSLGFEGIVTGVRFPADLPKLRQYTERVASLEGFGLLAFVTYDFNDAHGSRVWREALPILARTGTPLWVIVRGAPSNRALRDLLGVMASASRKHGIETVIYPHWDTSIESAAEAAALMTQVAHPNLRNSLHTCHEIRAGNQYQLASVVAAHAGRSALVTIAGADNLAYSGPPPAGGLPWTDAIRPLDEGYFSLHPFLQALEDSGYDGPVILHTFGITNSPGHLRRSLGEYAKYRAGLQ